MVKCKFCNQEETKFFHCVLDRIEIDGEIRPRIPYHKPFFDERYNHCHDCHVLDGFFHHPGCDMETCMNCGGQLISCSCETNLEGVKIPPEVLEKVYERARKSQPDPEFN